MINSSHSLRFIAGIGAPLPQEPEVLSTLISLRADVHARARSGISTLGHKGRSAMFIQ